MSIFFFIVDDATCGAPVWMGKGLTCVCFKRKGTYERICFNLTPLQASFFFSFSLFPTIIDRQIVDSMIIYCTVWFPVVAKSTAEYLQEERLRRLKHRMKICFDGSRQEHQVCCCFV